MQYAKYKTSLEEELATITEELSTLGRINPDNPKDWEATEGEGSDIHLADPNEQADHIEEYEERTAILKQLEIRYNELKDALARIEDDAFGTCMICEQPIEKERLDANPAARTCITHMNTEKEAR